MLQVFLTASYAFWPDIILRQVVDQVSSAQGGRIDDDEIILYSNGAQDGDSPQNAAHFFGIGNLYLPMAARAQQFVHRTGSNELPSTHNADPRADLAHLGQNVARHKNRLLHLSQLTDQLAHLHDTSRIETIPWLIEDNQFWIREQGCTHTETLTHTERIGRIAILATLTQTHNVQHLIDAFEIYPSRVATDSDQIVASTQVRLKGWLLYQSPHTGQQASRTLLIEALTEQLHLTKGRLNQIEQHTNCCSFARTIRAEKAKDLTPCHFQIQPLHR